MAETKTDSSSGGGGMGGAMLMWGIDKALAGFSALGNKKDVKNAKKSINADFQNKVNNLLTKKDMDEQNIERKVNEVQNQTNIQTKTILKDIMNEKNQLISGSGFAVADSTSVNTTDMLAKHNSTIQNLVASRKAEEESLTFNMNQSRDALIEDRDRQLAEMDAIPTTFTGGALGVDLGF